MFSNSLPNVVEALARDEAIIYNSPDDQDDSIDNTEVTPMPKRSLMSNFSVMQTQTRRFYVAPNVPYKEFYLVFKPFNKNYDRYVYSNLFDHVRKKITNCGKYNQLFITKETQATKIHYNAYCVTPIDLVPLLHQAHSNKFYIYCEELDGSDEHRVNILNYMIKESKTRIYKSNVDYTISNYNIV